jgi:hypothetical protein
MRVGSNTLLKMPLTVEPNSTARGTVQQRAVALTALVHTHADVIRWTAGWWIRSPPRGRLPGQSFYSPWPLILYSCALTAWLTSRGMESVPRREPFGRGDCGPAGRPESDCMFHVKRRNAAAGSDPVLALRGIHMSNCVSRRSVDAADSA